MMTKDDLDKFKRHMGIGKTYKIGEDEFYFEPLPLDYLPSWYDLIFNIRSIAKEKGMNLEVMQNTGSVEIAEEVGKLFFDQQLFPKVTKLLVKMVQQSYPELPDQYLVLFISKNYEFLASILMEQNANIDMNDIDNSDMQKINAIRTRYKKNVIETQTG